MLEDNLESRLPTSGSKCFTHPVVQKKVNTPSLRFTQKTIMKIMFVLYGVWQAAGLIPAAGLGPRQFQDKTGHSTVLIYEEVWRPSKRFCIGLSHCFPPHTKALYILMWIKLKSCLYSVLLGLTKKTTLAPVTQWSAPVEVIFMMAFYWDATKCGALLWWESTRRTQEHHIGILEFLEQVPGLELLHPHTSSLTTVLTGQPLCPYSLGEPAASRIVDPFLDCQPPLCHPLVAVASQTHAQRCRGCWTKHYHPATPTSPVLLGTDDLQLPSTSG